MLTLFLALFKNSKTIVTKIKNIIPTHKKHQCIHKTKKPAFLAQAVRYRISILFFIRGEQGWLLLVFSLPDLLYFC